MSLLYKPAVVQRITHETNTKECSYVCFVEGSNLMGEYIHAIQWENNNKPANYSYFENTIDHLHTSIFDEFMEIVSFDLTIDSNPFFRKYRLVNPNHRVARFYLERNMVYVKFIFRAV
jgi:hypothetical protein